MAKGRIRIKLKSYDYRVLDTTTEQLLDTALRTGAKIVGPIPLPTKTQNFTVLRGNSSNNKDSQEAYHLKTHKRLVEIVEPTDKTIDSLMHLVLPAGVEIEVKM
jgi:small subunit ribosomal protein S10